MENENIPISEQELLYDPMFAKNPNAILQNDPSKGFFGRIAFKKAAFIIVLVFFICLSMYFSFRTVSKDVYTYEENGNGKNGTTAYMLTEYHGNSRQVLCIDYVRNNDDVPDETKCVNEVGKFAINCNEALSFIYISDTVEKIDPKAFYTCKNLKAIFVDENNPNYMSVDGVLYRCENGVPVEIFLCPTKNPEYLASLNLGLSAPDSPDKAQAFIDGFVALEEEEGETQEGTDEKKNRLTLETENNTSAYVIPDTVITVNELCFSECKSLRYIEFGNNVTEIETLAFFKCSNLQELNLPDSLKIIGSDAFSSCGALKDIFIPSSVEFIGHHAFFECKGVNEVRMECSEEEADKMEIGQNWLPQKKKIFMSDVEVKYNEQREVK